MKGRSLESSLGCLWKEWLPLLYSGLPLGVTPTVMVSDSQIDRFTKDLALGRKIFSLWG